MHSGLLAKRESNKAEFDVDDPRIAEEKPPEDEPKEEPEKEPLTPPKEEAKEDPVEEAKAVQPSRRGSPVVPSGQEQIAWPEPRTWKV